MLKNIRQNKFGAKILMGFLFLVTALLICFSLYTYNVQRIHSIDNMADYNENIISTINQNFDIINESTTHAMTKTFNTYAAKSAIYLGSADKDQEYIDNNSIMKELNVIPNYHSMVLYNNAKNKLLTFNCKAVDIEDVINNIKNNGKNLYAFTPYITKIKNNQSDKAFITYYGFEYVDGNTMRGAIVVNVTLEWLEKIIKNSQIEGVNIKIVDSEGKIVYDYLTPNNIGRICDSKKTGQGSDENGRRQYITVSKLKHSNYSIICSQPLEAFYSLSMKQMFLGLILMCLVLLIFGIMFSNLYAKRISAPIDELLDKIDFNDISEKDMFRVIATILDKSEENTVRMNEMKRTIQDYNIQNDLIQIMNGNEISKEEYSLLDMFFKNSKIVGVELLFDGKINIDDISGMCKILLDDYIEYKLITVGNSNIILLLKITASEIDDLKIFIESMKKKIDMDFGVITSVLFSDLYELSEINKLFNELSEISIYRLILGKGCILDKNVIAENVVSDSQSYPYAEEKRIQKAIVNKDEEEAEMAFGEFLLKIMGMEISSFRASILRIIINIQSMLNVTSNDKSEEDVEVSDMVESIIQTTSIGEMCDTILKMIKKYCSEVHIENKQSKSPIVECMIEYVSKEYADVSLNIVTVADDIGRSPDYIRKCFKTEMNTSFNKYLTKYRLKKSVEYLNDEKYTIGEIATLVGFANESNFYRQFKMYYGVTPLEYKKIM